MRPELTECGDLLGCVEEYQETRLVKSHGVWSQTGFNFNPCTY